MRRCMAVEGATARVTTDSAGAIPPSICHAARSAQAAGESRLSPGNLGAPPDADRPEIRTIGK